MMTEEAVLKSDTKGRVRVPAERREMLLNEFEASSLSAMKFAALAGVKYATFANWIQRRRKQRATIQQSGLSEEECVPSNQTAARPVRLFEAFAEVGRAVQPVPTIQHVINGSLKSDPGLPCHEPNLLNANALGTAQF